jgi:thymidine kinase
MDSRRPAGRIELIHGCMFSGKTVDLLHRLRTRGPDRVRAFKHRRDDRYSNREIVSHAGDRFEATLVRTAEEILQFVTGDEELVGIDEGHFYDDRLPDVCRTLAARGIDVVVTSLDPDSWGRPFPVIEALKHVADVVSLRTAVCASCGKSANRNQRTTPIVARNIVGGPEAFEPRCEECWSPPPEDHIA